MKAFRLITLTLPLIAAGCGSAPADISSASFEAHRPENLVTGVSHVAPDYSLNDEGSLLSDGARLADEMGFAALKLFATPDYASKYPGHWPTGISDLTELLSSGPFVEALSGTQQTVVLVAYTFASGADHLWKYEPSDAEWDAYLAAEEAEMIEAVRFLATRYRNSGRTFILQNWEGDWALLGDFDPGKSVNSRAIERMREWLQVRQGAVAVGRQGSEGVQILHAVEANLVLDADGQKPRVVSHVLPYINVDAVSYSAWESTHLTVPTSPDAVAAMGATLGEALDTLAAAAPDAWLYLGEFGFPEEALAAVGFHDIGGAVDEVLEQAVARDVTHAIYWQLFDNECDGESVCPGYWLVRPDGTIGEAAEALKHVAL